MVHETYRRCSELCYGPYNLRIDDANGETKQPRLSSMLCFAFQPELQVTHPQCSSSTPLHHAEGIINRKERGTAEGNE